MAAEEGFLEDLSQRTCKHYIRRCALVTPCCNKIYKCRHCHNEAESSHVLDRNSVERIKCCQCGLLQALGPRCIACSIKFGLYYCEICRLFDDADKAHFHCTQCGVCRIGGRENYEHCPQCDICFKVGQTHKCIEKCSRTDCPICLEDLHSSRDGCQKLYCGHMLHASCFRQLRENYGLAVKCPLCCSPVRR